ncbi:hypothetical protein D0Z00_002545 [Geotrichum galactomycetum]|uniref:Uncharacterized protein n=1 Tax=Geotrichum galactomycetum TaxID=27317 RepID=A0ACB6V3S2_9ASCO|nr:hypothetical protein D0Z00_002545 [Geotrichum candidum]
MPTNTSPARHPHQHHHHSSSGSHTRASSRDAPVISATAAAAAADFDASVVPLGPKATTQRRYHRDFMRSSQHYASGTPSQPRASSYLHHTQQRSRRNPETLTDAPADVSAVGNGSFATGRKKKRSAHKKRDTADKIVSKSTNGKDQQSSPTKSHSKLGSTVAANTSDVSGPKLKLGFDLEQIRVSLPKVGSSLDDDDDDFGTKHRKQPSTMEGSVDSRSPSPSRSPVIRGISVTPPLMDEDEVAAGKSASTPAPCHDLKVSSIGTVIVDSSIVNKNRRRFPFEDPEYYAHQLSLYFYDLNNDSASHESHGGAAAAAPQSSIMGATVPLVHPALPVPGAVPGLIPAPPMSYYPAYDPYGVPAYPYSSRPTN